MIKTALAVAFACLFAISAANAKPRHHKHHHIARAAITESMGCLPDNDARLHCSGSIQRIQGRLKVAVSSEGVIGGRPAGCPHAYCGCGARLYLGIDDPRLNLAWNWTKYYHGLTPVAVWRHHIAIIERMTGPSTAILRDYNSGSGLSRIHERSIAGARIVGRTNLASR